MDMMAFTNIFLIVLCIFTMLLVWSRNWKHKQAYFEKIKNNPDNLKWLKQNLTGKEKTDLKNINEHFGLPLLQAKQLLEYYKQQSKK
ncbi:hypothetical protein [Neisseria sp. Marseille-Q2251]|uniref:hypothetical protein n=1 Tax=Neisseria sp. Marseille-Q2251 TaxID=2866585 RepID=UPI003139E605